MLLCVCDNQCDGEVETRSTRGEWWFEISKCCRSAAPEVPYCDADNYSVAIGQNSNLCDGGFSSHNGGGDDHDASAFEGTRSRERQPICDFTAYRGYVCV